MGCKYPENSRSYKACALCSDKDMCKDSTVVNNANADVNAAYQIMKKVFSNAMNEIVGVHLHPVIINL